MILPYALYYVLCLFDIIYLLNVLVVRKGPEPLPSGQQCSSQRRMSSLSTLGSFVIVEPLLALVPILLTPWLLLMNRPWPRPSKVGRGTESHHAGGLVTSTGKHTPSQHVVSTEGNDLKAYEF